MELFAFRGPWYIAGPLIGLLIVGLLWAINKPFGALGGYVDTVQWAQHPAAAPGWRMFFLLGIVTGGFLSALFGGYEPTFHYGSFDATLGTSAPAKVLVLVAAGGLVGYGARLAGGCTSGHGMCGTAMGSPASLAATMAFMGTAMATAHLIAWEFGG